MQTKSYLPKNSDLVNKVIDTFMVASGIFAFVWIMAFLLVAMFAN